MFHKISGIALMLAILLIPGLIGCSNSGNGVIPEQNSTSRESGDAPSSHSSWGLWQFIADPETGNLEYIQLREAQLHLNALEFLEPPPNLYLTLESAPQFSGNILTIDIGLRHPFLGLNQFTGFDVCGTLIAHATHHPWSDPALLIGGEGDTRLLNPDGHTRWWNPTEFPSDTTHPVFGYKDGLLGTPDSFADFTGILNGYKYYCDDLDDTVDPMSEVDPEGRAVFSAGMKNVRRYVISMKGGLIFNYAVDANWMQPVGDPPYDIPADFPPGANRPEAWNISVDVVENTLFHEISTGTGGGGAELSIDVYDWYNADLNTVKIYSFNDEFPDIQNPTPSGGGTGYSTYEVEISAEPVSSDTMPILIAVESEVMDYGGKLFGEAVTAYFMLELDVGEGSPVELPDICNNWGDETGNYLHWNNGQTIHDIYTQFNLASDNQGNVWMWSQRTSNALSRSKTAFNGDWGTMWEEDLSPLHPDRWIFYGSTRDVSLTPTFDGGLIAGCAPPAFYDPAHPEYTNELSIAWWDGYEWKDTDSTQWVIYDVLEENQIAHRINGYRDSTGRFHAFCQVNGELVDFYSDEWGGEWSQVSIGSMPIGDPNARCQTRTDFVAETSDGTIYVVFLSSGLTVMKCQAGTEDWNWVLTIGDDRFDSPTIYIDNQDRVFVAVRYFDYDEEWKIKIYRKVGEYFSPESILAFHVPGVIIDPCYLTLKGDSLDHLFLTFPYRPGEDGAYAAIIASKPGGEEWTDICVLSDPIIKHPGLAVRPDGSLEICYGYNAFQNVDEGSTDTPFSERQLLFGRSHQGFVD